MTSRHARALLSLALLLAVGCDARATGTDAGTTPTDSGMARVDSGTSPSDSGTTPTDSGTTPTDAGTTSMDGGPGADGGTAPTDSGTTPSDAGSTPDAGPCTPLPTSGSATLTGSIGASDPTWARPLASTCPATSASSVGTMAHYRTYTYCNTSGAALTLDLSLAADASGTPVADPYLVVYDGAGIPADNLMCLAGDDDTGDGLTALITGFTVAAGQTITFVTTTFNNDDVGDWILTITVP